VKQWILENHADLLQIARLCRHEAEVLSVRGRAALSPTQWANRRRLRGQRGLKVQIASGPHRRDGWVNVDAARNADIRIDLRRAMPFASDSVAMIFCEHFLDHVQYPDVASKVLGEMHRVLEPGGRARLVMHDAELLARAYLDRDEAFFETIGHGARPYVRGLNFMFRFHGFHQFIHDFESISDLLRRVGFREIRRCECGQSDLPEIVLDHRSDERSAQSMYVEAIK
jgi:predicted SAM-dependent methyltransferase